tara:strand:- start:921 stop:2165 length:1245 start_codon:yes stop_codon:yes gene_type:complete
MGTLTNKQIENLKTKDIPYRLNDSNGLYLNVAVSGTKSFVYRYQVYENTKRKDKWFTIGKYPKLSLKQARLELQRLIFDTNNGIDVQANKIARRKIQKTTSKGKTFEQIAHEFLEIRKGQVVESTWDKDESRIERFILPTFGNKKLDEIHGRDVLEHLKTVSETNGKDTAIRTMNQVGQILGYALSLGEVKYNVITGLAKFLPTPTENHHPAITCPVQLGEVIYLLENNNQSKDTIGLACRIVPHIFLRISEILAMRWEDIDFRKKIWDTDISKTKKKGVSELRVFLSEPVIDILKQCKDLTGDKGFVFAGGNRKGQIDDSTVRNRMKLIGIDKEVTKPHGFRATALSMGEDVLKFDTRVIDMCMAHKTKNPLGTAYDRAERLDDRKKFMNAWSDYLFDCMQKYQKSMSKLKVV